jgi:hypothetical protein
MNNKAYHNQYQQYISYNIMRDTFMGLYYTDMPEDAKEMVKLMFKDQFGMVEFQGDIISSTKRNRLAHSLD